MTSDAAKARGMSALLMPLLLGLALAVAGCQPQAPTAGPATHPVADQCSERLHDLSGMLLLYYAKNRDLPKTLSELSPIADDLACPLSKEPYIYNPDGVPIPRSPGHLIIYDPRPSHFGGRWGILALPPKPGKPLVLSVIVIMESEFAASEPQTQPEP